MCSFCAISQKMAGVTNHTLGIPKIYLPILAPWLCTMARSRLGHDAGALNWTFSSCILPTRAESTIITHSRTNCHRTPPFSRRVRIVRRSHRATSGRVSAVLLPPRGPNGSMMVSARRRDSRLASSSTNTAPLHAPGSDHIGTNSG